MTCYVKHDTEQLNVFQYLSIHIFASVEENERRKERKIEKKIYEKYLIFLRNKNLIENSIEYKSIDLYTTIFRQFFK